MKHLLFIALLNFAFFSTINAQTNTPKYINEANKSFNSGRYFEALPKLQSAYTKLGNKGTITQKGDMAYKVAECYRHMEQFDKAKDWYANSIELKYYDIQPLLYFWQGEMQRMMGKFDDAIKSYKEYKKRKPANDFSHDVESAIKSVEMYKDFEIAESKFIIKNENKLNKVQFDMAPTFSDKKGMSILYGTSREDLTTSTRDPITGEKFMDIWTAEFDLKRNFISAKSIDNNNLINTGDNEGTAVMDKKGKTLYFTRCPTKAKQNLGCDIWKADKNGEDWENVMKITLKTSDTISVGHPCITEDGMMLIFASDMTGGKGGRDLWYVMFDKKNKVWDSIPKNMGAEINTTGNELFPSIGANNRLYFASDGHPGIGGLDIFFATRVGTENTKENPAKWSLVTNMQYPINSIANDYAMADFFDEKTGLRGYFTSERQTNSNKIYSPDIWSFSIPPVVFDLRVVVFEAGKKSKRIMDAKVEIVGTDGSKWEGMTDKKGSTIKWDKKADGTRWINGDVTYSIKASKDDYFEDVRGAKFSTDSLDRNQSFLLELPLLPKYHLRTPEIRYYLDKWTFVDDATITSTDSLKFLDSLLTNFDFITIDLYSHTDARDTEKHNQALSENRAKAVYVYLVDQKGIDPRRIRPVGKGESEPAKWIDENGVEQTLTETYINQFKTTDPAKFERLHQMNRRTDVKITSEKYDPKTAAPADPNYKKFIEPLPR